LPATQINEKLSTQLDTDRRRRYAASSPMPKIYTWYRRRVMMVLVLTALLPVVCWALTEFEKAHTHHGHGEEGHRAEGHGHAEEGHAAAHGVAEAHNEAAAHHRRLSSDEVKPKPPFQCARHI